MFRSALVRIVLALTAFLPFGAATAARDKSTETTSSMSETMAACVRHCQATQESIGKTLQSLDGVKDSTDIAKLKGALAQAHRELSAMQGHMTECMEKMRAMHQDGGGHGASPQADLVTAYLNAENLLVKDKLKGVPEQLSKMHAAAQNWVKADEAGVREPAQQIVDATAAPADLDSARSQFKRISNALMAMMVVMAPSREMAPALYEAYCPMAKASWLQTSKEISNPYMGQSMPECGKIRRQIGAVSTAK